MDIKRGQIITFKPEWMDKGDEDIVFVAVEDSAGGTVKVEALLNLTFNPIDIVEVRMIATAA